jgi:LAO/AO transport system kinase
MNWVDRTKNGHPRALARAITAVENRAPESLELLKALFPHAGHAHMIGLTGAPGAGKSTLVDQFAKTGGIWNATRVAHVAGAANMNCMIG